MNSIGNIIWVLFGGIILALSYFLAGLLMCITIIGIPFGIQLFKIGGYVLWPFGHDLVNVPGSAGCLPTIMNLIWVLCGWWEIALMHVFFGVIFCVTIVGIPLGMQHFKIALATLFPFGKEIR